MVRPGPVARHADGPGDVDPRRDAHAEPFLGQQIEDDRQRLGVGDIVGHVDRQPFEIGGDPALPDAFRNRRAFRFQRAMGVVVVERGPVRVRQPDPHARVARPQALGDPGERAARPDCADEAVHPPAGLRPDLVAEAKEVVPVRGVRLGRSDLPVVDFGREAMP